MEFDLNLFLTKFDPNLFLTKDPNLELAHLSRCNSWAMATISVPELVRSTQCLSLEARNDKLREAAADPENDWESLKNLILSMSNYYITHPDQASTLFETEIHDLWEQLIQLAKLTPADDPAHDRLVSLTLWARELGALRIKQNGKDGKLITPEGLEVWTDLPYLEEDMQEAWQKSMDLTPVERHNFAAFTARLMAVGVSDTGFGLCALWLLRETLETPRPLTKPENGDEISVAELLPACLAWFEYCNFKLLRLAVDSDFNGVNFYPHLSAPGELAREADVEQLGFSVPRWLFWRRRFKELSRCKDEQVAKKGRQGFDYMITTGITLGYKISGERKYMEKLRAVLEEELIRSGKDTVTPDDVVVDLDWAD